MKTLISFAVAGVLAVGVQVAEAQTVPSSGSADAYLFVFDQATQTTFAEDLGSSTKLSSLLASPASNQKGTVLQDSIDIPGSAALQKFISTNGASNLQWAVLGAQFTSTTFGASPGAVDIVDTVSSTQVPTALTLEENLKYGALNPITSGINNDVVHFIAGSYVAGGASYSVTSGSSAGAIFGFSTGDNPGSTNLYGQGGGGLSELGTLVGKSTTLYGLTGGGSKTGNLSSYVLAQTLTLGANGTLSTPAVTAVPVPAAFWLLGSGLAGLIGVRRRALVA